MRCLRAHISLLQVDTKTDSESGLWLFKVGTSGYICHGWNQELIYSRSSDRAYYEVVSIFVRQIYASVCLCDSHAFQSLVGVEPLPIEDAYTYIP